MIPNVDNYVEWFTCSIRYYFMHEGYGFLSYSLEQVAETGFPSAALAEDNVMVGLTFLRPAQTTGAGCAFQLPAGVHAAMLAGGGRLLYALPQTYDAMDQQLLHQKTFFATSAAVDADGGGETLVAREAADFKQLVAGLADGSMGYVLATGLSVDEFLREATSLPPDLWLVMNRKAKLVVGLKG